MIKKINKIISILVLFLILTISFGCSIVINPKTNEPIDTLEPTKHQETAPQKTIAPTATKEPLDTEPTIDINPVNITIYAMNDFHGVIMENEKYPGLSKVGEYLVSNKTENTLIVSSGDMFQGTALSSMTRGRTVVDCMNYIGFDAMAIGNHEFDWGIDEVMKYRDGDSSNGEADFPFLCANCLDLNTDELASWCTPYTIIEKLGIKIGIIGIIGSDEESDILPSFVSNYDFTDEVTAIKKYTKILRNDEGCNLVLLLCHCDTSDYNQTLVNLSGEYRIDAIFNGHTHQAYYGDYKRSDSSIVPYVQSGCYGSYIGKVTIMYDKDQDLVLGASAQNFTSKTKCKKESSVINAILSNYQEYIDIANEELGPIGFTMTKDVGGVWAATVLKEFGDCDFGICNKGGIRSNAFPMNKDSIIKYDNIFQMMPFENKIVKCELSGTEVIRLISSNYYLSDNVDKDNLTIDGVKIERDKYYSVCTIDYLFEQSYTPFERSGRNIVRYVTLFREALVDAFLSNVNENGKFIR